jgi:hypothetical protein
VIATTDINETIIKFFRYINNNLTNRQNFYLIFTFTGPKKHKIKTITTASLLLIYVYLQENYEQSFQYI